MRLLAILFMLTLAARAQWTIQTAPTTADLRGIDNVGGGVVWASGSGGTVLHSVDGGATWLRCVTPTGAETLDFRGVQAFDAKTAIVMSSGTGDLSRLYKTTDGCRSWKLVFINPDKTGFWDGVAVWYFQNVYPGKPAQVAGEIIGDPVAGRFCVYQFFDGYSTSGRHPLPWHNTSLRRDTDPSLAADAAKEAVFAASNSSYIDTEFYATWAKRSNSPYGRLFVTGGEYGARAFMALPPEGDTEEPTRWAVTALPLSSGTQSSGAFSVAVAQERPAAIVVGGDYQKPNSASGNAAYSLDRGKSWQAAATLPHGYRSAVAYDPATKSWITVGPNGTDVSTDDGRNWRALRPYAGDAPDADKNWNALSLPFVVGPKGRIGVLHSDPARASSP